MSIPLGFAFIFFCIGTFVTPTAEAPFYRRFNLVSAGLACWTGALLFSHGIH